MRGRVIPVGGLDPSIVEGMLALMSRHFEGVTRACFERDLATKDEVVLVEDEQGRITGFSSFAMTCTAFAGQPITAVYSGDTVVDPSAWQSPTLSVTWIGAVLDRYRISGAGRLYWLLLVSGFRTYRFLPVFWREFYPCHLTPTPQEARDLMRHLAALRYGSAFDAASGVVRLPAPHRLSPGLAGIPEARLSDPHVACFARLNPGHADGDELVCLTEITEQNLTRAGRRMVRLAGCPARPAAPVEEAPVEEAS